MDLETLQQEQNEWQNRNFPNTTKHQCLLGVTEEVGELSHAHLKCEQGIRGTSDEHIAEAIDAIGDIVIFLAGYCNSNGYDLSECVTKAWEEVKNRDWSEKGRTPEKADKNFNDHTTLVKTPPEEPATPDGEITPELCVGMPHGSCKGKTMCDPTKACFEPA